MVESAWGRKDAHLMAEMQKRERMRNWYPTVAFKDMSLVT
jgi:hypothetical protein